MTTCTYGLGAAGLACGEPPVISCTHVYEVWLQKQCTEYVVRSVLRVCLDKNSNRFRLILLLVWFEFEFQNQFQVNLNAFFFSSRTGYSETTNKFFSSFGYVRTRRLSCERGYFVFLLESRSADARQSIDQSINRPIEHSVTDFQLITITLIADANCRCWCGLRHRESCRLEGALMGRERGSKTSKTSPLFFFFLRQLLVLYYCTVPITFCIFLPTQQHSKV